MKVDLLELLRTRDIVHPSSIQIAEMRGRQIADTTYTACDLRVVLSGCGWWRKDRQGYVEERYEFLFEDLFDGTISARLIESTVEEALEDLVVRPLADIDWAQGPQRQVFCSGPLRDPFALYMALEDHLLASDAYLRPEDFLNWPGRLRKFAEITASDSYLVARAPASICKVVTDELDRQVVPHNSVGEHRVATDVQASKGLWVRLNGSSFLCRAAVAVLPDP